jgi:hypothetical protein
MKNNLQNREIIIEFRTLGPVVRATAFDTETLTEVHVQGPASAPEAHLRQLVLQKLEYVLRKKGIIG